MSETSTTVIIQDDWGKFLELLPDGTTRPVSYTTDWARVDAKTEEELHADALSDPDNPPLTDEELANMRRPPLVQNIRLCLGLSQREFAAKFKLPLGTVRDWEQEKHHPDRAATVLLTVIARQPEAVANALAEGVLAF